MFKKSNKTVNIRTQIVSHSQKYKHGLHEACGILAPWPGIKPTPPALEGEGLGTGPSEKSLCPFLNE